jgi:hypothetical protein
MRPQSSFWLLPQQSDSTLDFLLDFFVVGLSFSLGIRPNDVGLFAFDDLDLYLAGDIGSLLDSDFVVGEGLLQDISQPTSRSSKASAATIFNIDCLLTHIK